MEPWIVTRARAAYRRRLWVWLAFAVVIYGVTIASSRYLLNFFAGPFKVTAADLQKLAPPLSTSRYFVSVDHGNSIETGLNETEVTKKNGTVTRERVTAYYDMVAVGGRALIVKRPAGAPMPTSVSGVLTDDIPQEVSRLYGPETYPFILDAADNFRLYGYILLPTVVVFTVLLGIKVNRHRQKMADFRWHPLVGDQSDEALHEFGDRVRGEIDSDESIRKRPWVATKHYLVGEHLLSFSIRHWQDILWAYPKETVHRHNGIKTGTTFEAVLRFPGQVVNVAGPKGFVELCLGKAAENAPWAIFGYDAGMEKHFTKRPAELVALVEERRAAFEKAQNAEPAEPAEASEDTA